MGKTEHTPGPWGWQVNVNDTGYAIGFLARDGQAENTLIAKTPGISNEDEANARLMASAPDLLERRDALLEALEAVMQVVDQYPFDEPEFEQAHAAIAKARGK